jgi:hypothetical protein
MVRPVPSETPQFAEGMRHHNEGAYYEAHESWEELWHEETDDQYRLFLQGLIQVTSAFHKVFFQKQPGGAQRLLARGLVKLAPYPEDYLGVALGPFRTGAQRWAEALRRLEPTAEALEGLEPIEVPRLEFLAPNAPTLGPQ